MYIHVLAYDDLLLQLLCIYNSNAKMNQQYITKI